MTASFKVFFQLLGRELKKVGQQEETGGREGGREADM